MIMVASFSDTLAPSSHSKSIQSGGMPVPIGELEACRNDLALYWKNTRQAHYDDPHDDRYKVGVYEVYWPTGEPVRGIHADSWRQIE